MKGNFKRIR